MKYGEKLVEQSVPEWSLHNVDYNSLKHEIKVHTSRDQAVAIAIPGQTDRRLQKFEDRLYRELCGQHERVDLFVSSKEDEIARRIEHVAGDVQRLLIRCQRERGHMTLRRQRRLAKYERALVKCSEETSALERFSKAQITAFRKILKKYKKWTGSTALGAQFKDTVLNDPKSFTRRDFSHLEQRYRDVLAVIHAAHPRDSEPTSPSLNEQSEEEDPEPARPARKKSSCVQRVDFAPLPPPTRQQHYWNEYDYGSDTGGDDSYTIYIDPDEDFTFPGLRHIRALFAMPVTKARALFRRPQDAPSETDPLISSSERSRASSISGTIRTTDSDSFSSDDPYSAPTLAVSTLYGTSALTRSQREAHDFRQSVLLWGAILSFVLSFVLLGIAAVLLMTGRNKLRAEVDAGATVGSVASLFLAGAGVAQALARRGRLGWLYGAGVATTAGALLVMNVLLLVLIVGDTRWRIW